MGRKKELQKGILGPDQTYQADLEPVTAHVVAQYHNAGGEEGGSSFYVHGGEAATSGYSVGGLEGAPETTTEHQDMAPKEYQEHRDRVRESVKNPNAIAGTWVEGGRSVMDASERVPDKHTARVLQIARNQRAVYNLGKGREEDLR